MKRLILFIFIFISLFFVISCKKQEEEIKVQDADKVEEVMLYIEVLPENITLKDEKDVEYCLNLYNALIETDKSFVENYEILENAINTIKQLKLRSEKALVYLDQTKAYLEETLFKEIDYSIDNVTFPKEYIIEDDGESHKINIMWVSEDPYTLSSSGIVSHKANDVNVKLTATISSQDTSNTLHADFTVKVIKRYLRDISNKKITVGYFSYNVRELNKIETATLDILNYGFGQIVCSKEGKDYKFGISTSGLDAFSNLETARKAGIRLVLSLGGWHNDSTFWDTYSLAASTEEYRNQVADAIYSTLQKYNLDGIDIDWEYPQSKDKANYTLLVEAIRKKFNDENCPYLITMAIPGGSWVGQRYDLVRLQDSMDYYYIMSYDFDSGTSKAIHHSALYNSTYASISADSSVNYLLGLGIKKDHILVGGAFYGRCFTNVSTANNGLGSTFSEKITLNYTKIKEDYLSRIGNGVTQYFDSVAKTYYLFDSENNAIVFFDSTEGMKLKCQYVIDKGLKGLMFWSMGNDTTGDLIQAINEGFK